MALLDRFSNEADVDHHLLQRSQKSGGWTTPDFETDLDDVDNLDEPLAEDGVRNIAESENWPAATYQMVARREDGTLTDALWQFDHEPEGGSEELTQEEKLERRLRRMESKLEDGRRRLEEPGDLYGAVAERLLDGEELDEETLEGLGAFAESWQSATAEPPEDPGQFAALLASNFMAAGEIEGAAAVLDRWFEQGQSEERKSLVELASDSNLGETSMDDIKTLGLLQFLEDPRGMMRDLSAGMMDAAQAPPADAQAGGRGSRSEGPFSALADASDALAGDRDAEREAPDPETRQPPAEPEPAVASRGAEFGLEDVDELESDDADEDLEEPGEPDDVDELQDDAEPEPAAETLTDHVEREPDEAAGGASAELPEELLPPASTYRELQAVAGHVEGVPGSGLEHEEMARGIVETVGAEEALRLLEAEASGTDTVADVERELEAEREGEDGQPPNAEDAMQRMQEATDGGQAGDDS